MLLASSIDFYMRKMISRLQAVGYRAIQFVPSRQAILIGQETVVLSSFLFRNRPCIFNSSVLKPIYMAVFKLTNPGAYDLFNIFFKGEPFSKDSVTGKLLTRDEFDLFAERGFFIKDRDHYRSAYRFIPIGELILVGRFDEASKDYAHMGYDTMVTYENMKRGIYGANIDRALEIGCGIGFLSIAVSRFVNKVDAVDINPGALRIAELNVDLNGADNAFVFLSDIYDNVSGRYDYIFSNPPFELLPNEKIALLHSFGGEGGIEITRRILEGMEAHLSRSGFAHILTNGYVNNTGRDSLKEMIERVFHGKKYDIRLKELTYQLRPEYYRYYREKGIRYSVSYFITLRRADSYSFSVERLSFVRYIRERMRLSILILIALFKYRRGFNKFGEEMTSLSQKSSCYSKALRI